MARPRAGRLPRDVSRIVGTTAIEFIPIHLWGGVKNGVWQPRATTETVTYLWHQPKYDVASALNIRVLWSTNNTTTTNSITPRILYARLTEDTTAVAIGSTALDTVIAADNPTATAHSLMKSAAGVLAAGTVTDGQLLLLALNINAVSGITLGAGNSDNVNVYGVILEFVPTNVD